MLEDVWRYQLHHGVAAFAADGDHCYATARSTKLVAIRIETGEVQWSVPVLNPHGWIALNARTVFYLNQHARLVAIDRDSGAVRWVRDLNGINGWLHASGTRVVVGGWRGYTDITVLDEQDGTTCWSMRAQQPPHSTRIHAESDTLMVVDPAAERVTFARLADGEAVLSYRTDHWSGQFVERPSSTQDSTPVVVEAGDNQFLIVRGTTPSVETVSIGLTLWSRNLVVAGRVVPFVTIDSELAAWDLPESRRLRFGRIDHNRRDTLPFCQIADDSFVVGTSRGVIALYRDTDLVTRRKVGKRVETHIARRDGTIVFGTASGEVVALTVHGDG